MLGYPVDRIAVIDAVEMNHTKPVGSDCSRFEKHPSVELNEILLIIANSVVRPRVFSEVGE